MAKSPLMTPGVYIEELNAFPNSVVEVATAIPAFIGFTASAAYEGKSYLNKAVKITSMADYLSFFGGAPQYHIAIQENKGVASVSPVISEPINLNGVSYNVSYDSNYPVYYLYNSMRLFFQNGGGTCYVISVGLYADAAPTKDDFARGLSILEKEYDPTMIVIPDSLLLSGDDYSALSALMLDHCQKLQNRISLFDVYNGFIKNSADIDATINQTRQYLGYNYLNYGVAYFPWLCTGMIQSNEVDFTAITVPSVDELFSKLLEQTPVVTAIKPIVTAALIAYVAALKSGDTNAKKTITPAHNALLSASPNYKSIITAISNVLNVLPATPAMAGVYTAVDNAQGVWKAPANVSLNGVIKPTINLNDEQQQNLNIDAISGKSINAIRTFTGQGVLVWGARTLDGNSQDWKYISVRRTLIMIEQSIKLAARAYIFSPNDVNTWLSVKSMIMNFLNNLWKQGALVGAKPEDAYNVSIGLGSTMTAQDILDDYMNFTVLLAVTHPAEFIVINFQQQMQQS